MGILTVLPTYFVHGLQRFDSTNIP